MKWYRTGEVAARLGWESTDKVRDLCREPNGRHFRNARLDERGQWRIPECDLEAYERFRDELTARIRRPETPKPPIPPKHSE